MSNVDGSSSEEEDPADQANRRPCGQFVLPCPRDYPSDKAARVKQTWLITEDMSKEALGKLFKAVLTKNKHGASIVKVHVFDEPHKKFNPKTKLRSQHKHVIFKVKAAFAHVKIAKELAAKGVHGHFSFNLHGYAAYLNCILEPSAKKLACDIDNAPWSYPPTSIDALHAARCAQRPQEAAKNATGGSSGGGRIWQTL